MNRKAKLSPSFWRREFGVAAVGNRELEQEYTQETRWRRLKLLLRDYLHNADMNGTRPLVRPGVSSLERFLWGVCLMVNAFFTTAMLHGMWEAYDKHPSEVDVANTALPLYSFPFPSVTVCPNMRVRKSIAYDIIQKANNLTRPTWNETEMAMLLWTLSRVRVPMMTTSITSLGRNVTALFSNINTTEFMLAVLPTCSEVFGICYWAGRQISCCDYFRVQSTRTGFCYAFNSLSAFGKEHCPLPQKSQGGGASSVWSGNPPLSRANYDEALAAKECQLLRGNGVGIYSGIEVFLHFTKPKAQLSSPYTLKGYQVVIGTPSEFPDPDRGVAVGEEGNGSMLAIGVQYTETEASSYFRHVPLDKRRCYFPDEFTTGVLAWYNQDGCLYDCRIRFMREHCNCTPYFSTFGSRECDLRQLQCLAKISPRLLWLRTDGAKLGVDAQERAQDLWPDCRHCWSQCTVVKYRATYTPTQTTHAPAWLYAAFLNVYYAELYGATKYTERLREHGPDLLVSYGGALNLFLGMSVLSLVQIVHYAVKAVGIMVNWPPTSCPAKQRFWTEKI